MTKTTRARHTLEFKREAVRLVEGGQSIAAAARTLGVIEQTLFNWVASALDRGRSLFGGVRPRCENLAQGKLRTQLWRHLV
jgi:transposase